MAERNAKMTVIEMDEQKPALCLFATKHIDSGSEILYNYGVQLPWQSKKVSIQRMQKNLNGHLHSTTL